MPSQLQTLRISIQTFLNIDGRKALCAEFDFTLMRYGKTALMYASSKNSTYGRPREEIIKLLLNAGADHAATDK